MDRFFGTSDSYSHFLGLQGHQAHEIVPNCQPLQRAWATEHGVRYARRLRLFPDDTLVLAQVEEFKPDVVYLQDLGALSPGTLRRLRAGRLLIGQIASKAPPFKRLDQFDLILTSLPHFVPRFRERGISTEYFRIGFDPRVLPLLRGEPKTEGVVFVGGLARGPHAKGNKLLERVAGRTPVHFWGYKASRWPATSAIRRRYRGEAWGLDMYRVLARAKISLNRHIDVAEDYANNMRLYESTGVGTLLLTDAKRNLADLFEPGEEVVTYSGEDELVEKIEYYLENEEERERIASAGQRRTRLEHTYERRMEELVEILGRYLS